MKFKNLWALLVLFPTVVLGVEVDLSWTNPIQNTDGTNIALTGPGSLESVTIYWSICDPSDQVIVTPGLETTVPATVPGDPGSTTVDIGTPGRWCFIAEATNVDGFTSDFSGVAIKTVVVPPNPPTGLTVGSTDLFAYYISQSNDVVALVPVGTVPEGTSCDGTMSVNQHYRVPRADVAWVGSLRPPVVFALCQ